MTPSPADPPPKLAEAVAKRYGLAKATLLKSEYVDYRSELKPLWNGTVFTYRMRGQTYSLKVYVFEFPRPDGTRCYLHFPASSRWPKPLDAVKAALRQLRSAEQDILLANRDTAV